MLTLKQHIRKLNKSQFKELGLMCTHSRALYNSGLYMVKEYHKETNKYLGYNSLYKEIKNNIHYKSLPAKIAQQILRLLDKDYRSFFALLSRKNKGQYAADVNSPKFKKKDSKFILILPSDQIRLTKGKLKITKNIRIPFSLPIEGVIKQATIKPKGNYYEIYLTYEPKKTEPVKKDVSRCLSVDLGMDNLATCFSNVGRDFIINGKPLKAANQFYNKTRAEIQTELKVKNNKSYSRKLDRLTIHRNNFVNNYIDQTNALIINYCNTNNIGKLIVGYNETWKSEINLGKKTNQNFVSIPHYKLKKKLQEKCVLNGIEFVEVNESYTSKCSALDLEPVKKHEVYIGKRVKRGLFVGSKYSINADINGAINIMRKVIGDSIFIDKPIERCIVHPIKLNPLVSTNKALHIFQCSK